MKLKFDRKAIIYHRLEMLEVLGAFYNLTIGIMVCNKLRQPQNYIEAVDPDSVEMKTAEFVK